MTERFKIVIRQVWIVRHAARDKLAIGDNLVERLAEMEGTFVKLCWFLFAICAAIPIACVSKIEHIAPPDQTEQLFVLVQPEPEPAATQDELAIGGFLFANMCASCHGGTGQGARRIGIARSDYAGVREIITRGTIVYGGNMPAWSGILSAEQIDDVAKYILANRRN